jgi:O-antigen/teichoic acid export membrane protein
MFGAILLALGTLVGLGLSVILLVFGLRGILSDVLNTDPLAVALLLILITISPIDAFSTLSDGLLAIFASPSAIFIRRHVLGPGLKLGAVLVTIMLHGNAQFLAFAYLIGGLLGMVVYATMILRVLRNQRLTQMFKWRSVQVPAKEILGFSAPLMSSDLVYLLRGTLVVVFLEYFWGTKDVAEFRAVLPVAGLNMVVLQSFSLLFTPMASRLFARGDQEGINNLYWQTALWIAVMSFPIFAVTVSLAQQLVVLLFGTNYANAGILLALLSFGQYFNAALGFNAYTLRVYGKVRYILAIDILAAVIGLGANLWLISHYGALGAAIGMSATLILHNILNHAGLHIAKTGIKLFQWNYLRVYVTIIVGAVGLFLVDWFAVLPVYANFVLVAIISLVIVRLNRSLVRIEEVFPELLRIPGMQRLLS